MVERKEELDVRRHLVKFSSILNLPPSPLPPPSPSQVVERKEELDVRRHLTFVAFGFAYLGGFQYYLYTNLFQKICHPLVAMGYRPAAVAGKVFLDQGIQ